MPSLVLLLTTLPLLRLFLLTMKCLWRVVLSVAVGGVAGRDAEAGDEAEAEASVGLEVAMQAGVEAGVAGHTKRKCPRRVQINSRQMKMPVRTKRE
jgi:hypothetical protein